MTRRELREHVFRVLFACDFCEKPARIRSDEGGKSGEVPSAVWTDEARVGEQIDLYFTHTGGDDIDFPPCDVAPDEREEVRQRVLAVAGKVPEIDSLIDRTSTGWKTARMARADLSILRLAVYEMICDDHVPTGVAINEAVLLAKKFGGDDSSSFVNGILAKLERLRSMEKQGSEEQSPEKPAVDPQGEVRADEGQEAGE